MRVASAPELLITVGRKDGHKCLTLGLSNGQKLDLPVTDHVKAELEIWRNKLPKRLEKFHTAVVQRDTSRALQELRYIGLEFQRVLTQDGGRKIELEEFFAKFRKLTAVRHEPARISLVTSVDYKDLLHLSIEYLLIGRSPEREELEAVNSPHALEEALACYAGFSAVVSHSVCRADNEHLMDHQLKGHTPKHTLPVKIIRHEALHTKHATFSELPWLEQRRNCSCENLWPDKICTSEEAMALLVACFSDPHQMFNRERRSYSDQIQHISCHYDSQGESPVVRLRDLDGSICPIHIEVDKLQSEVFQWYGKTDQQPGPFVFVNACASGAVTPGSLSSLIDTVLFYTKARAVLVTEAAIHFPYAADFARLVYSQLFSGRPLGEAILCARRDLVRRDQNPFGILYTLYGNPNLRIPAD